MSSKIPYRLTVTPSAWVHPLSPSVEPGLILAIFYIASSPRLPSPDGVNDGAAVGDGSPYVGLLYRSEEAGWLLGEDEVQDMSQMPVGSPQAVWFQSVGPDRSVLWTIFWTSAEQPYWTESRIELP